MAKLHDTHAHTPLTLPIAKRHSPRRTPAALTALDDELSLATCGLATAEAARVVLRRGAPLATACEIPPLGELFEAPLAWKQKGCVVQV